LYVLCIKNYFFQLEHGDEVKKRTDQLNKAVADMYSMLQRINAPNMKAMEK